VVRYPGGSLGSRNSEQQLIGGREVLFVAIRGKKGSWGLEDGSNSRGKCSTGWDVREMDQQRGESRAPI